MDVIASAKRQRCLHMTVVNENDLHDPDSKPVIHPVTPFERRQEEGACIMQLDLVVQAHRETHLAKKSSILEESENDKDQSSSSKTQSKADQVLAAKARSFTSLQKSYTEISQLLALTNALNEEKEFTLVTCTRPSLQTVGLELPAMQRVDILQNYFRELLPSLRETSSTVARVVSQRRQSARQLVLLKRRWRLDVSGGRRGRRLLSGRDSLSVDCGLGNVPSLPQILKTCLVPLRTDDEGTLRLPQIEARRDFSSLFVDLCTPEGLTCVAVNTWELARSALQPLGLPEGLHAPHAAALEAIHVHCQHRQSELMDEALMVQLRLDASRRADRWLVAPPSRATGFASAAEVEAACGSRARIDLGGELDVQVLHKSEVVVRLSDSLLLRLQLRPAGRSDAPAAAHKRIDFSAPATQSPAAAQMQKVLARSVLTAQLMLTDTDAKSAAVAASDAQRSLGVSEPPPVRNVLLSIVDEIRDSLLLRGSREG